MNKAEHRSPKRKPSIWQVITSTCAAAFGVQTDENRQRDFANGNIKAYILSGITFTLLFIGLIIVIVQIILSKSGVA